MPLLSDAARFIATRPGQTAAIGAGLGAAANVGREALRADDGQPKNYLGKAIRGAQVGGAVGGALGFGGRAMRDTLLLNPSLRGQGAGEIAKATAQRAGTGISNMVQRQFHGLTGYGSGNKEYLNRIGIMGEHAAADKARLLSARAQDDVQHLMSKANPQDKTDQLYRQWQASKRMDAHAAELNALQQEGALGQKIMDLGMSSAPGSVKSLATNPRETSKAIWDQVRAGGGLGTAIALGGAGMGVYSGAKDIARGDESAQGGRTVGEKIMRTGADVGGNLLFWGLPMGAQMAATPLATRAAGGVGRFIDPAKPQVGPRAAPEDSHIPHVAPAHVRM